MKATADRSRRIMIALVAACAHLLPLAMPPKAHGGSFNSTVQFAITNGNPNGSWSYGWMATNFTSFTLLTNASFVTNLHMGWWGADERQHAVDLEKPSLEPGIWCSARLPVASSRPGRTTLCLALGIACG